MTHTDRVYTRAQILDQVWGDHVFLEDRTVDVHIRRLREALSPSGTTVSSRPYAARDTASDRATEMLGIAASALAAAAVGWFAGEEAGLATFCVLLLLLLVGEYHRLRQLTNWLEHGEAPEPPRAPVLRGSASMP